MHQENILVQRKVAIVTGGSSGIGKALVVELLQKGYAVSAVARNNLRLQQLCESLSEYREQLLPVIADVSSEAHCSQVIQKTIEHFGKINVLINNAGISMRAKFIETNLEVLKQLMNINFWGTVYCTKYALPYIIQTKGTIVGISSIAGLVGLPGRSGYSASKFAIHGFLESIRTEHKKDNIHVMIVCPGFVASNIRFNALNKDGLPQGESPRNEQKMTQPSEVAKIIMKGIEKQKKYIIMTTQGKLIPFLKFIVPSWLDKQVLSEFSKEQNSPFK